jgi:hypothetical protein
MLLLVWYQALVNIIPFARIIKLLNLHQLEQIDSLPVNISSCPNVYSYINKVRKIILLAERNLPFINARCLSQALTARSMLNLKGITSVLHIGVLFRDSSQLSAHAWLISKGVFVTGHCNITKYRILAQYK